MLKISSNSTMQTIEDVFCDGNLRFLSMRKMATINDPITTDVIEEINKSFFILTENIVYGFLAPFHPSGRGRNM